VNRVVPGTRGRRIVSWAPIGRADFTPRRGVAIASPGNNAIFQVYNVGASATGTTGSAVVSGTTLTGAGAADTSMAWIGVIPQTGKYLIAVDRTVRMDELICDGVLISTPAGSTAYNLSAHGPILPINAPLLAMTPISPFRPRRWRGALLANDAKVVIEVLEPEKRPVSAVADHTEFRDVVRVEVVEESGIDILMMFDPGHTLAERILSEQFGY
jgi:NAD+ kinase